MYLKFRSVVAVALGVCCLFLLPKFVVRAQNAVASSTLCETGCLLPPTGLVGWWAGDGNANDIQLGSNGTPMNGATFASGLVGQAFSFDGVSSFVDVPDAPVLHAVSTAVSVEAWINPQRPFGQGCDVITCREWIFGRRDPFSSEGVSLYVGADGFLVAILQANALSGFASAVPVVAFNGQWQHVAVTADTSTGQVHLYLNGKPLALQLLEGPPSLSGQFASVTHLFIGQRQSSDSPEGDVGGSHFNGLIDEVALYNRALSASEIQAIFSVGPRGKCKPATP